METRPSSIRNYKSLHLCACKLSLSRAFPLLSRGFTGIVIRRSSVLHFPFVYRTVRALSPNGRPTSHSQQYHALQHRPTRSLCDESRNGAFGHDGQSRLDRPHGSAQACLLRPRRRSRHRHGCALSQRDRSCGRHGQGRHARERLRRSRLRPRRSRHDHAARPAGQPQAPSLPPHSRGRHHQPHGLQQPGRGAGPQEPSQRRRLPSARRRPRDQHRQERRDPDRKCALRLREVPRRRL